MNTETLASMVGDGQKTAEYVYDAFGRLLWRKGSDGTESRHYCDGINELLVREKPQAGSWRTRYVQALAQSDIGQVLARRTATGWSGGGVPSTWTDRYYHYDTLGNAVMESDHHGDIAAFVDMEAFGNVVAGGASGPRLTTKWSDPDSGMYYFNARWYDSRRGNFVQRAPESNLVEMPYALANNSSLVLYDSTGAVPSSMFASTISPDKFVSDCEPALVALLPNGNPLPPEGSDCSQICFDWLKDNAPIGPMPSAPVLNPPNPPTWSKVLYFYRISVGMPLINPQDPNLGQGSHVGLVVGGCVVNCHGKQIRYYSPNSPTIPSTTGPRPVDKVVHPW